MSTYLLSTFDREGPGVADVYILRLEEFTSVGMLPSGVPACSG